MENEASENSDVGADAGRNEAVEKQRLPKVKMPPEPPLIEHRVIEYPRAEPYSRYPATSFDGPKT